MSTHFLPWVRQGIATAIPTAEAISATGTPNPALASSVAFPVSFKVNDRNDASVQVAVRLHGPGDIIGIDSAQVVRTEPPHLTPNFEPNYFAAIEFDRADFPWLFTPLKADQQGRLRPWICLIVVRQQAGVTLQPHAQTRLPVLTIQAPARPEDELPDLEESWAWAHGQVVSESSTAVPEHLTQNTEQTLSRLLCPRQLTPNTQYYACLVPAFEVGRKTGLGLPLTAKDEKALQPAWKSGRAAPVEIKLPVYYHWEFSTGLAGDFESLVLLLEDRPLPDEVGVRMMDVRHLRVGEIQLPDVGTVGLEGALRRPGFQPAPLPPAFEQALQRLLNLSAQAQQPNSDPIVAPPIYGQWQALQNTVPDAGQPPRWLRSLNLDVRHRAAAGFGTLVIQDQQEALMASAWQQLGAVSTANQFLRQAQFTQVVQQGVYEKRLKSLSPEVLFQVTEPVHSRVLVAQSTSALTTRSAVAQAQTIRQQIRQSNLPRAVDSTSFRRVMRSRSPLNRRVNSSGSRPTQAILSRLTSGQLRILSSTTSGNTQPISFPAAPAIQYQLRLPGRTPEQKQLLEAALTYQNYLADLARFAPAISKPDLQLFQIKESLLQQLNPTRTISALVRSRLQVQSDSTRSNFISSAVNQDVEPFTASPAFPQPMYEALRDISQDLLLPGLEHVPPNTVTLLETNPEFVEAYMVGLNQEMSRELLWRNYGNAQHDTYFRQFWDGRGRINRSNRSEALQDIPAIHEWEPQRSLGEHFQGGRAKNQVVLLLRGELLSRYPTAVIYAVKAVRKNGGELSLGSEEEYPLFQGTLKPDVTFLGFNLAIETVRGTRTDPGYFFVIQQQPTEPRFGLNTSRQSSLKTWEDLSWQDVATTAGGYLKLRESTPTIANDPRIWKFNAAHMAAITRQQPVRIAIHANDLLSPKASP